MARLRQQWVLPDSVRMSPAQLHGAQWEILGSSGLSGQLENQETQENWRMHVCAAACTEQGCAHALHEPGAGAMCESHTECRSSG